MTDNEFMQECSFEVRLGCYKENIHEFFSRYKNKSGGDECVEMCLIREGYRTVLKAEEEINRQRQELEMASYSLESMLFEVKNAHKLRDKAITNAIQDFAERLKNKLTACSKTIDGECEYLICDYDIDNLVKEMLGEQE